MACKSFGDDSQSPGEMRSALKEAYDDFRKESGNQITFRQLIEGNLPREYKENQTEFEFSTDAVQDESISNEKEFEEKLGKVAEDFFH